MTLFIKLSWILSQLKRSKRFTARTLSVTVLIATPTVPFTFLPVLSQSTHRQPAIKPTSFPRSTSNQKEQTIETYNLQEKQDPTWAEGSVRLLTITSREGGHSRPVRAVAFHPNNRFFSTGGADRDIKIWDLQSQSRVKVFSQDSEVLSVSFSPDGRWLASSSIRGVVRIWNWQANQLVHTLYGHEDLVTDVIFTADSQHLISAGGDQTLKVWRVSSGENVASIDTGQFLQSIAIDPQNPHRLAVAGLGRRVEVWNWQSRQREQVSESFRSAIYAVDWHPNSQQLAFSPDSTLNNNEATDQQNTVRLFSLEQERFRASLRGHSDYISFVAFSPSGKTLLSGSWDRTIKLWNTRTGSLVRSFLENERRVLSGDFSNNGKAFIVGSGDGTVKIYRTQE